MIHSLGALASHAADAGTREAAESLHQLLEQEFANAQDSNSRVSAVVGLGNARNEKDIGLFVGLLASDSELERGAAIRALGRQASNPSARRALASVVETPQQDTEVKDTAVRALGRGDVSEGEYESLSAAASTPDLAESTANEIGITLTRKLDAENTSGWRSTVESLARNSTGPAAVQANGLLFLDSLRK